MDFSQADVLDYYAKITQDYDSGNTCPPDIILPPVPEITEGSTTVPSPHQYLLPSVIMWDPLQQFESFSSGMLCPHSAHDHDDKRYFLKPKKSLKQSYMWHAGQRPSLMPRQLSSSSWPTVLLSRIYHCDSKMKHKPYIGHDPEILSMIHPSELHLVPFSLLHRTGFTKELGETVISLTASGMNLEDIEQVIYQQHLTNFAQCKAKFEKDRQQCLQNADIEVEESPVLFPEYKSVGIPSMEMILGSLLDNFQDLQMYYHQRMSEVSATTLLMGHFFKVSQQIGTVGSDGKHWVSLYDYIFAVMNEKGQVLAWQVTKGTSMQDVFVLLENLHKRLTRQEVNITLILTPECCQQKDLITSIFGSNVSVKMDPQFAHQRIEKKFKIRKGDHDHVITCLQDFKFVFHQSTDLNSERNEETPSADIILGNLCTFISKWKTAKGETHERLLHDPALRELDAIKSSASKGCLSNIPPNSGAKHVKALKSYLNPIFSKRFLNADLAIPALIVVFYYWNENHNGNETVLNINSYKSFLNEATFTPTTEKFGLIECKLQQENKENEHCDPGSLAKFVSYQSNLFPLLWGTDDHQSIDEPPITTSGLQLSSTLHSKIMSMVENYFLILQNLKSICPENVSPLDIWHCHLLPCCTGIFRKCGFEDSSTKTDKLQNNLEIFGGSIVNQQESEGFFAALYHALNTLLAVLEVEELSEFMEVKEHLNSIGYKVEELQSESVSSGVEVLKQIISGELQKNKDDYTKLVPSTLVDVNQEHELFTQPGYHLTEISNVLPVVTVKVLKLSLVIFTSMEPFPVVPVVSVEQPLTSSCLFIGYSAEGLGTYHPITITSTNPIATQEKSKYSCRCGLGNSKNKKERKFCVQVPGMYLTRCDCYRSGEACNYLCRCFNCANPRGTSTESRASHSSRSSQKTRLRSRHKLQQMKKPFKIPCRSPKSSWNDKECLAFQFLITALQNTCGVASISEFKPERVSREYEGLHQSPQGKAFLKPKSLVNIREHLNIVVSSVDRFHALFRQEIEKQWNSELQNVEMSEENQLVVIVESSE